jgi:hypothetical protein
MASVGGMLEVHRQNKKPSWHTLPPIIIVAPDMASIIAYEGPISDIAEGIFVDSITGTIHNGHNIDRELKTFDLHHPNSLRAIAEFIEDESRYS